MRIKNLLILLLVFAVSFIVAQFAGSDLALAYYYGGDYYEDSANPGYYYVDIDEDGAYEGPFAGCTAPDPSYSTCWNSEAIGVTDCGQACDGGKTWQKYEFSLTWFVIDTFLGCLPYFKYASDTCSTGDKYNSSNPPVMRAGYCDCSVGGEYKTCCNIDTGQPVNARSFNIDPYAPPEADCNGDSNPSLGDSNNDGIAPVFCGFDGYPPCGAPACQADSTPQTKTLNVRSSPISGVIIDGRLLTDPSADSGFGGITNYTKTSTSNIETWLVVETDPAGYSFSSWSGCDEVFTPNPRWCKVLLYNGDTQTVTANFTATNQPPTVSSCSVSPTSATVNISQGFSLSSSASDPDGSITTWRWFWGDGTSDDTTIGNTSKTHTYTSTGSKTVQLQVLDNDGAWSSSKTCGTVTVSAQSSQSPPCEVPQGLPGAGEGYGDVCTDSGENQPDGKVTNKDKQCVDEYVAGSRSFTSAQIEKADVDDDPNTPSSGSDVTTLDSLKIGRYINGSDSTFPVCNQPAPVISSCSVSPTSATQNQATTFTIPTNFSEQDGGIDIIEINWGDGTVKNWEAGGMISPTGKFNVTARHTYTSTGSMTVGVRASNINGDWSNSVTCGTINVAPICTDECSPLGVKQCLNSTTLQSCGDYDDDPCLEWGNDISCPIGSTCQSGQCVFPPQCSDNIDNDGDGCIDMGDNDCTSSSDNTESGTICNTGPPTGSCTGVSPTSAEQNTATVFYLSNTFSDPDGISSWEISWESGDTQMVTVNPKDGIAHSYRTTGSKTVYLRAQDNHPTDPKWSPWSTCGTVTVSSPPLDVSCAPDPNPAFVNQPVLWDATVSGGTPPYSYSWTAAGGSCDSLTNEDINCTYASAGTYSASVQVTDSATPIPATGNCPEVTVEIKNTPKWREVSPVSWIMDVFAKLAALF